MFDTDGKGRPYIGCDSITSRHLRDYANVNTKEFTHTPFDRSKRMLWETFSVMMWTGSTKRTESLIVWGSMRCVGFLTLNDRQSTLLAEWL